MKTDAVTTLLLTCLNAAHAEDHAARLALLAPDAWEELVQLAQRHGVTPLLYHRLKPYGGLPPDILQTLRADYLGSARRNMQLYHELARVLQLLRCENIPVIVLKGAHLAEVVYGNIALRPMGDVDLLIKRTDLARVETALLKNGYRPVQHNSPFMQATHFHFTYIHTKTGLPLEIHWHIVQAPQAVNIDLDQLWQCAQPANLAGVETLVFAPEDLLVYLCLHLLHHKFDAGLRAVYDLTEVIRHYNSGLNWERVIERSQTWKARKAVYLSLWLAKDLLKAPVPDEILKTIQPPEAAARKTAVREQILNHGAAALSLSSPTVVQLGGKQSLPQKAAALLRAFFPTPEYIARLCPVPPESPRVYLYYPMYIKNLLKQYGRPAWRLLRGDKDLTRQVSQLADLDQWLQFP